MKIDKSFIEIVQEGEWEGIKKFIDSEDEDGLKHRINSESKLKMELMESYENEKQKNKKIKVFGSIGCAALLVITGVIFFKKGRVSGIKAVNDVLIEATKCVKQDYEIYKNGLCAFIDDSSGHIVSTIEAEDFDTYKSLSEEAVKYFKDTFDMLVSDND